MDLSFGQEYEKFRAEVRAFVAEHWPPAGEEADLAAIEQEARFRKRAIERGYIARSVPRTYGGSEQPPDALRATIIREEFGRCGAPQEVGTPSIQVVPTLLSHGTESQKREFLPRTITGELIWCQGYSEPQAGSDLASVQTRAELVGDQWLINGQKIWTTRAHQAHMIYLLCRTEPDAPKHAGISYVLVEMDQPGIQISPLKGINGERHFNQVFFNDARAPADRIVGKRGEGWIVSRSTLQAERDAAGTAASTLDHFDELVELARTTTLRGQPALQDRRIRQRLVELEGYVASHAYSSYRQLTCDARGESPGLVGTMNKLVGTDILTRAATLALDIIAEGGLDAPRQPGEHGDLRQMNWLAHFFRSLGQRAGGGASNIQRNIIGERGLGLPRDFAAQRSARR